MSFFYQMTKALMNGIKKNQQNRNASEGRRSLMLVFTAEQNNSKSIPLQTLNRAIIKSKKMRIKNLLFLIPVLFVQVVKAQVKIDLDLGYPIGTKQLTVYDKIPEDSVEYFDKIKKDLWTIQHKIHSYSDFKKEDFEYPEKINFEMLKEALWLTKDNVSFDFDSPNSGHIKIQSIEILNDTLKLKEVVINDQYTLKAYVEAELYLNKNIAKMTVINLSITKYIDCYCDGMMGEECREVTTEFFPENKLKQANFSYPKACWSTPDFFIRD